MKDHRLVADWIFENYPSADKIVEIGVGESFRVLDALSEKLPKCDLIATDIREVSPPSGVKFIRDDITHPNFDVYREADLLFSIRNPPELYPYLKKVASRTDADLLVKPVSSEERPPWGELVNYSGLSFFLLKNSQE